MLSSQALDGGGVWDKDRHCSSNKKKFTFDSAVHGYHVYKVVWKTAIGEKLHTDQELDNEVDKFAGKVVKNNEIVGHFPRKYSRILWYFYRKWQKDMCGIDWP